MAREMRTQKEINEMIGKLKKLKTKLPEHSAFGDPNHLIIDAQLDVLELRMTKRGIDELDMDEYGDMGWSDVMNAYDWMMGTDVDLVDDEDLKDD